jgi:PAS domain S-box-containing protein
VNNPQFSPSAEPKFSAISNESAWKSFRHAERREWVLWAVAFVITLLLTIGVVSFLIPGASEEAGSTWPQVVRALVAVVLLFDIYTIYQRWQIFRVRRQLFQRDELFRLISDNATDLIAVADMQGRRLYDSSSFETVLGYSPEELAESAPSEQIHPEDLLRTQTAAQEARATRTRQKLEYRMRHKDGTWRVMESTVSVIRGTNGGADKLLTVNRDITEREFAREALRVADAGYRSVVDDAPYGIYCANREGRLLRVNPALQKMLGYTETVELLKANLESQVFKVPAEFRKLIELLDRAGECKDNETEWKRKDGGPITVRCCGRRIADGGQTPYYEMFVEDVTDERVLERQLQMAGKMEAIGRLSGGIAHDFNNLLGVIIGYSQVLIRALGPGSALTEHATEIEKAGERAAALTRQLLAFSRQQILTPTVLNLNTLVADMQKMLPRLIGEDITVNIKLGHELRCVRADRNQIEQIILNLAVNSRDAMPEGGKLVIETENVRLDELYVRLHPGSRAGEYVRLTVTDTGNGMDSEILAHIFEPFFTTKEVGKGTGLGLATVYGVVKQSGGYVWVDSEPNQGASFQIYLPRIEDVVQPRAVDFHPAEQLRGSETILLVEDAETLRNLAATFLAGRGFQVLAAPDAEQALEIAATQGKSIQLLLTDVIMPGQNGRVLAERVTAANPHIKVLYMSGYTDSFIAGHGVLGTECHLLHKPFTESALIRKVREVLDGALPLAREMALAGPSAARPN